MKSKFEKSGENDEVSSNESGNGYDPEAGEAVEVDDSGPDVATSKGSKMIVLVASAVLITVVLYFFFFRGGKTNKEEKMEEVSTSETQNSGAPAKAEAINDFSEEDYILEKPKEPELPKLPELPKDASNQGFSGLLPSFMDLPQDEKKEPQVNDTPNIQQQNPPSLNPAPPAAPAVVQNPKPAAQPAVNQAPAVDPRKSPIIVLGGSSVSGVSAAITAIGVGYEKNIVKLKEDEIDKLKRTASGVVPTVVANMPNTIIQGKLLTAVLETAISTELPGVVRAIVSRDVYAEAGNNILIPKGSRLYGSYSSEIVRGQARVQIGWTRLIRPDGVDMNITFNASDQFGRSGIEGEVDNKYGSIIGNSILTSVLAIGGAIAAEKLAGGSGANTTTTDALGNVTSTGQASNKLIYDASKSVIDTVGQVVGNAIDMRPLIRVPQGTRITIVANADITLPNMRVTTRKTDQ